MLALVPDEQGKLEPKMVGLREALSYYIAHQEDVVTRRTRYDLEKDEAKRHIDEGLLIAIDHIDEIIRIAGEARGVVLHRESIVSALSKKLLEGKVFRRTGRNEFALLEWEVR